MALGAGYDVIGEMDADGSHQPEQLPSLLAGAGRRRPGHRRPVGARRDRGELVAVPEALSRGGNLYVRLLLGMDVHDATAGYRLFRRATLERIDLGSVQSTGYVFQTDLTYRTVRAGLRVREVPIEFVERVRGDSKMSGEVAGESLRRITVWGLRERRQQLRRTLAGRTR